MNLKDSSEADPVPCRICGSRNFLEPSGTRVAPCPSCGSIYWAAEPPTTIRSPRGRAAYLLRTEPRRPMFGIKATLARQVDRLIDAVRTRRAVADWHESSGVYDHWLDG